MADINQCLKNAQAIDPNAVLCEQWICEQSSNAQNLTKFCHCQAPYPPQNPCPYGANTPVVVFKTPNSTCFCCCSCFAYGTRLAVGADQFKAIETFTRKDTVLAAGEDLDWKEYPVEFSSGVLPSLEHGKTMLTVYYGEAGQERSLVVTPDHVFLTEGKTLKRANLLVPGQDKLTTATGETVPVLATEIGGWYKGVHHIGTSADVATSVEGHLLNSEGIVSGDWSLQISTLPDTPETKSLLEIGGREYADRHAHLGNNVFRAIVPGASIDELRPQGFKAYGSEPLSIPEDAELFITRQQAKDIYDNWTHNPVSSTAGQDMAYYLMKLFRGFYPDIHFDLQWDEMLPNAYSFEQFGVKFVILAGGLVRTTGISYDSIALVLAHEVGHLIGGPPLTDSKKYSCQGQADYAATSAVLRGVFYMDEYPNVVMKGVDEIKSFFSHISPEHQGGAPDDTCNRISIECREEALLAGMMFAPLPACAGGPKVDFLTVLDAVAELLPVGVRVTVAYSLPLDVASAQEAGNYTFSPSVEVVSATVNPEKADEVFLDVQLVQQTQYELTIKNVIAGDGKALKDDKAVVSVQWNSPGTQEGGKK
jgi:hypothetical protein